MLGRNASKTSSSSKNNETTTDEQQNKPKRHLISRKGPLPMKLRALPRSFWEQPNKTTDVAPGFCYKETSFSNEQDIKSTTDETIQDIVTSANTDLLFSLFQKVEDMEPKEKKAKVTRRGRPKKVKSEAKTVLEEDPYLGSNAREKLLSLLPARDSRKQVSNLDVSSSHQEPILSSNTTSADHNYSQLLSQLVVQL